MENLKDKKILALIPARAGSKAIPKKNIIDLGGYPLLAYPIAAAKMSKYINRTILTTDSQEFADIGKAYGAEAPFLRPEELAQDMSVDKDFFVHALDWLEQNEQYVPDMVVHLRPITPLRDVELIDKAIEELVQDEKATALRSAHESEYTAYKLYRKEGEYMHFFGQEDFKEGEEYYNYARQQLPETYNPNGYVDIILPETIKNTNTLHGKNIRSFVTERVADIDVMADVEFAQKLLSEKRYTPLLEKLKELKP